MEKLPFILAIIGHILCGVTDCLLGFSPKGRLDKHKRPGQDVRNVQGYAGFIPDVVNGAGNGGNHDVQLRIF